MKIIDIVPDWKETFIHHEGVGDVTEENFMNEYELNGKIAMENMFETTYGMGTVNVEANFYCGPSIGDGETSDIIYITEYMKKICDELHIKCYIDASENYHILEGYENNEGRAQRAYKKIKDRISQDFKIDE
jgi:hypothetical protein